MDTGNSDDVRRMASDIVSSYMSNNQMRADEVPGFIKQVIAALSEPEAEAEPAEVPEEKREPAVPIRRSVTEDAVICLDCGAAQKTLKRHIRVAHDLTEAEYRARWGLTADHPIVSPAYSKQRSAMAKTIGLGKKSGRGRK